MAFMRNNVNKLSNGFRGLFELRLIRITQTTKKGEFCFLFPTNHLPFGQKLLHMNMPPRLRKLALATHVVFSVGWFGSVMPYLALAVTGLTSHDVQMVRAAYLSMNLIGWYVIVPLSLAALLGGLVQSFGTQWGLFRHWWVSGKFALTTVATVILILHMQAVGRMARVAAETTLAGTDFMAQRIQLIVHPAVGLLVLLAAVMLSIFKPWGMTPYGLRRGPQDGSRIKCPSGEAVLAGGPALTTEVRWKRIVGIHAMILAVALIIALHIMIGGVHMH